MIVTDTLRMWWMFTWRSAVLSVLATASVSYILTAVMLSLVTAFILRVILGFNLFAGPVMRLIRRQPAFQLSRKSVLRIRLKTTALDKQPTSDFFDFDYSRFSPRGLGNVSLPSSNSMYGVPGAGLSDSNFSDLHIELGQRGEENFAKSLGLYTNAEGKRLINTLTTFWSVAMPSAKNPSLHDEKFETDIDCIAIAGKTVYLIDLKFYESNGAVYSSHDDQLFVHGKTSRTVKMTRNMAMAQDRFRKAFPNVKFESRVVFVPTGDKPAILNNVEWPGKIPAVNLHEILNELATKSTTPSTAASRKVGAAVQNLLKH